MSAPFPSDSLALRCLALRAIMDGRGVEAAVLSSPRSLAHYGGSAPGTGTGALLVVTAREALWVAADAGDWTKTWAEAARLLPEGCALGHEGGAADGLAALAQAETRTDSVQHKERFIREFGDEDGEPPHVRLSTLLLRLPSPSWSSPPIERTAAGCQGRLQPQRKCRCSWVDADRRQAPRRASRRSIRRCSRATATTTSASASS